MDSQQVRVKALIIGKELLNTVINVPKGISDDVALQYGHEFIRRQYPVQSAKGTVLEEHVEIIKPEPEPKPEAAAPAPAPEKKDVDTKRPGKRGMRDLETASRKQVKERLHQVST